MHANYLIIHLYNKYLFLIVQSNVIPFSHSFTAIAQIQQLTVSWNGTKTTGSLQSIPQGSDVTLTCHFTGVPTPSTVGWVQNGVPLTNGVFTNDSVTMVTIRDFQSSSVYQCHVENKYGHDIETVFLCLEVAEGRNMRIEGL